jgi:hypothetical protein
MKPLEDPLEIAYGSDILSLIAGYDVDADRRQRNREIACSGKYKPTEGEMQTLLECIPGRRKPGDGIRPPALQGVVVRKFHISAAIRSSQFSFRKEAMVGLLAPPVTPAIDSQIASVRF